MYVPPPPPLQPPAPPKKPSPLVPLLVFGAIGLITIVAAIAAGLMIFVSMRDREAHPPASELPVVEKPREPKPAPAFVEPAPPLERDGPGPRPATAEAERRPAARPAPAPRGVIGNRPGEAPADPPPPPPRRPLTVGGNIPAPTKIRNVNPVYPQIAISARIQGAVIIEATIDREGKVSEARVLRSVPLLDQAALDAVRQWEYAPTRLNGEPVPVIMTVTVNFTLR